MFNIVPINTSEITDEQWDDFTVSRLLNLRDRDLYRAAKIFILKRPRELLKAKPLLLKISSFSLLIVHHVYYFSILILFLLIIVKNFKKLFKLNIYKISLLFISFGLSIHLFTVEDARFKYPYVITFLPFAAFALKTNKKLSFSK